MTTTIIILFNQKFKNSMKNKNTCKMGWLIIYPDTHIISIILSQLSNLCDKRKERDTYDFFA